MVDPGTCVGVWVSEGQSASRGVVWLVEEVEEVGEVSAKASPPLCWVVCWGGGGSGGEEEEEEGQSVMEAEECVCVYVCVEGSVDVSVVEGGV